MKVYLSVCFCTHEWLIYTGNYMWRDAKSGPRVLWWRRNVWHFKKNAKINKAMITSELKENLIKC